jgi:hypothetical protein
MEHWWNENVKGKTEILREKSAPVLFAHHNSTMNLDETGINHLSYSTVSGRTSYFRNSISFNNLLKQTIKKNKYSAWFVVYSFYTDVFRRPERGYFNGL